MSLPEAWDACSVSVVLFNEEQFFVVARHADDRIGVVASADARLLATVAAGKIDRRTAATCAAPEAVGRVPVDFQVCRMAVGTKEPGPRFLHRVQGLVVGITHRGSFRTY